MKFVATYSHHHGVDIWKDRDLYEWVTDIFEAPRIAVAPRSTSDIRQHVKTELEKEGWAFDVRVDPEADLTVFAKKADLVLQIQTGNISRYAYDLLKIQHMYARKNIDAAVLAVPTKEAASNIGSNVANVERIWNELKILDRIITVPLMIVAFE
ncbi:hypothetical protein [Aliihoeflea sp. 40Bstr573]|uniref:hypothetical protein n=1 Tax=Aliihoeflea sp. 40Bstr573 TaxID=2696467 RepID=UPI0020957EA7|nr:hypothetical protein [Aliihoeflea sp. 40Bstr573]MCO6388252.1 restriction endonuclease [Aliihoeflea sp. 40Bstr573]